MHFFSDLRHCVATHSKNSLCIIQLIRNVPSYQSQRRFCIPKAISQKISFITCHAMLQRVYSLLHSRRIGQKKIAVLSKFTGNRKRIAQKNQKKIEVHGRKTGFSSFPDYQENENGKWEMVRKMNVFLGLDPSLILAIQTLIKRSGKN